MTIQTVEVDDAALLRATIRRPHKRPEHCEANPYCIGRRIPGSRFCAMHDALQRARAGDAEAERKCRELYGIRLIRVAR